MEIKYEPFDSPRWETYGGAYGNVCDDIKRLMGELPLEPQTKLRRLETEEKTDEQILFDNICTSLYHQMSFYDASYLAVPYLTAFLERKKADFAWQCAILSELGCILATDIPENRGNALVPDDILQSYAASTALLRQETSVFIKTHTAQIRALDDSKREALLIALLAILEDRTLAYMLFLNSWQEYYFVCGQCEYCYEGEDEDELENQVVPASDTCEAYKVCYQMLCDLGATEQKLGVISNYYGTLTCPECGAVMPMLDAMKGYFFE